MNLIDTHTHLYVEQFDPDRDEVIERAMEKGVSKFFIPAIDSSYYERMFDLRDKYPEAVIKRKLKKPSRLRWPAGEW